MTTIDTETTGVDLSVERRPAGGLEPLDVVRAATGRVPYVFHRTAGTTVIGLGVALSASADEGDSFRRAYERVRAPLQEVASGSDGSDAPRLFFQVAFDSSSVCGDQTWGGFERRRVVCPRLSLRWHDGTVTVVRVGDDASGGERAVESVLRDAASRDRRRQTRETGALRIEWTGAEAYRSAVHRAIDDEETEKAVIARTADVFSDSPLDPAAIVSELASRHGASRLFAVSPSNDSCVFLGASPERLIRLRGRRADTMALAGTADCRDRDPEEATRQLMQSAKDRHEHDFVARMIVDKLRGLDARVDVPGEPRPVVLPNVVHLETPISAQVPESVEIVDLVEALHPTPAVCGTPTEPARRLIGEVEPFDRGLYTGVLGWSTLAGEGDATVALRCGLVGERRARLYAGGGITSESVVEDEAAETESKFEPMLQALREGSR